MTEELLKKREEQLKGALILCGILLFAVCLLGAYNYTLSAEYNEVVTKYNNCSKVLEKIVYPERANHGFIPTVPDELREQWNN